MINDNKPQARVFLARNRCDACDNPSTILVIVGSVSLCYDCLDAAVLARDNAKASDYWARRDERQRGVY